MSTTWKIDERIDLIACFVCPRYGGHYIYGDLTAFGCFKIAVMHFWRFCWPHLEIWGLQSCIFCTFDDFIWTSWDLWSNILLCFHDCIRLVWDLQSNIPWFFMTAFGIFRIYSQLIPLFFMIYFDILQYAVNLGLYLGSFHCTSVLYHWLSAK